MLPNGSDCDAELDAFGLLAHQDGNLGNRDNWIFVFRAGVRGLTSRLNRVVWHSQLFHSWSIQEHFEDREHHIAAALFCMDSAMECLVFALNALGQAVDKSAFRDVSSRAELRGISPRDVLGEERKALRGYASFFPTFQAHWRAHTELIRIVTDNHDVSKHRHSIFFGGTVRDDPPPEFSALGVPEDAAAFFAPLSETLLPKDPKEPAQTMPVNLEAWTTLESLEQDFIEFLCRSVCLAVSDARRTIPVKETAM